MKLTILVKPSDLSYKRLESMNSIEIESINQLRFSIDSGVCFHINYSKIEKSDLDLIKEILLGDQEIYIITQRSFKHPGYQTIDGSDELLPNQVVDRIKELQFKEAVEFLNENYKEIGGIVWRFPKTSSADFVRRYLYKIPQLAMVVLIVAYLKGVFDEMDN